MDKLPRLSLSNSSSKSSKQITIINECCEDIEIRIFRNIEKVTSLSIALKEIKILSNETKNIKIPRALQLVLKSKRCTILCITKKNNYLLHNIFINNNTKIVVASPDLPDLEEYEFDFPPLSKIDGFLHYTFNNMNVAL